MADTIFWKRVNEDIWHKISSSETITWTQETIFPEFEEGQQDGITYLVTIRLSSSLIPPNRQAFATGPIAGLRAVRVWNSYKDGFDIYLDHKSGSVFMGHVSIYAVQDWAILTITYSDGTPEEPPEGESQCKTTFSTGLEITENECILISREPDSCECCDSLLPGASRILGMLG